MRATICFEAIAGDTTGQIMSAMPSNSKCIMYGCLSEQPIGEIDPLLLIGRNQVLESFLLPNWLKEKYLWQQAGIVRKCINMMRNKTLASKVQKRVSLFEMKDAIVEYKQNMTAGKYVVYPHQDAPLNGQEEVKQE